MADDQAVPPPADAVTAAAKVIHSLTCGECDYHPDDLTVVSARDREDAAKVIEAALPHLRKAIADQAAAAERERIRAELAEYAEGVAADKGGSSAAFAVLKEFLGLLDGTDGQ